MSRIACVVAAALGLAVSACDPGYGVWLRNASTDDVIVQFLWDQGAGTGFPLPADGYRGSLVSLGSNEGPPVTIQVMDPECKLIWETTLRAAHTGGVVVSSTGTVAWVEGGVKENIGPSFVPLVAGPPETARCLPEGAKFSPVDRAARPSDIGAR